MLAAAHLRYVDTNHLQRKCAGRHQRARKKCLAFPGGAVHVIQHT